MIIRREEEADFYTVENLTREAFWNVYRPGCTEHFVLHVLRNDPAFVPELDYVIEKDKVIVANIVYALANLHTASGIKTILTFGPVSVLPEYQCKGYGSEIIKYSMQKAAHLGYEAICITGNPDYYNRFGFESASKYGIYRKGESNDDEAPYFMVKFLNGYKDLQGIYSDPDCYFPKDDDVNKFDELFSPKVKEKRPGQLDT